MKEIKVLVEATLEVSDEFNADNDLYLCVAETDTYTDDEIPYLVTDYFRVVDYHNIDILEEK